MCRAASNCLWVSAANSSARYQQWPGMLIRPDGRPLGRLRQHTAGVMVHAVDTRERMYDPSRAWRRRAMRMLLSSGRPVRDRRSTDRRSL
jgi:hypothetical protein